MSSVFQDIEKGNHDDEKCEKYRKNYNNIFGQKLPNCRFKDNKSKIQNLIQKVHINANGSVTEVQFENKTSKETKSLQTKMKNFFRRK